MNGRKGDWVTGGGGDDEVIYYILPFSSSPTLPFFSGRYLNRLSLVMSLKLYFPVTVIY
jgi:hypothetical protein